MIRDAMREFYDYYYSSIDFKKWRDEFAFEIYSCLSSNIDYGEVKTVTALCDVMKAKEFRAGSGRLRIESRKTHSRSTSGVKFDYIGKQAVTELADMVIVSLVTFQRKVLLLKTAFIQNKKATPNRKTSDTWGIDQKQLFLLKNFPTFDGVSGIFNNKTMSFLNHTATLGNYGLFSSSGDMIFLTAKNTFCNQKGVGNITLEDMRSAATNSMAYEYNFHSQSFCRRCHKYCMDCSNGRMDCIMPFSQLNYLPFFNNYSYALDVHEIVKDLTFFNIGEPSNVYGRVTDKNLYDFTSDLLLAAFGYSLGDGYFSNDKNVSGNIMDDDVNIVLNILELGKEY